MQGNVQSNHLKAAESLDLDLFAISEDCLRLHLFL